MVPILVLDARAWGKGMGSEHSYCCFDELVGKEKNNVTTGL